jgi:hypothetical protein
MTSPNGAGRTYKSRSIATRNGRGSIAVQRPRVAVNAELGIPLEAYMNTPYTPFIQKPQKDPACIAALRHSADPGDHQSRRLIRSEYSMDRSTKV